MQTSTEKTEEEKEMILINFSHPLTTEQRTQIESLTEQPIARTIERPAQFDTEQPFAPQVTALIDALNLSLTQWQTEPLLLIPPALNFGAVTVQAELHGRCGYFVPIVRLRPVPNVLPPRYEVAEIINLQTVRAHARETRAFTNEGKT